MKGIYSIEATENVALVSFKKIPHNLAFLADIFGRFSGESIVIDMISQTSPISGHVSISFTCSEKDMVKVIKLANSFSDARVRPMVSTGNCKLRISGEEMRDAYGVFARAMNCLSKTSAELLQVTTSEVEISLLIPNAHFDDAMDALNAEFGV